MTTSAEPAVENDPAAWAPTAGQEDDSTTASAEPAVEEDLTDSVPEIESEPETDDLLEHLPNWEIDDTDIVVLLELSALWDDAQGAYAVPGVVWGTDKTALFGILWRF